MAHIGNLLATEFVAYLVVYFIEGRYCHSLVQWGRRWAWLEVVMWHEMSLVSGVLGVTPLPDNCWSIDYKSASISWCICFCQSARLQVGCMRVRLRGAGASMDRKEEPKIQLLLLFLARWTSCCLRLSLLILVFLGEQPILWLKNMHVMRGSLSYTQIGLILFQCFLVTGSQPPGWLYELGVI
jgi:hypothetical protein